MRPKAPPGPALSSAPAGAGSAGCAPFFSKRGQYTLRDLMSFRFTAAMVQSMFGGELVGDPAAVIERFSPIDEAGPGSVTFIWNKKYYSALKKTRATLVLVPLDIDRSWTPPGVTLLVHETPYL